MDFVHKESKNNDFIQQFFSSSSHLLQRAAIVERVSRRMRLLPLHVNRFMWKRMRMVLLLTFNTHMRQHAHALFTWSEASSCVMILYPLSVLSIEGQKALGFHQKYLNLCSEDERTSYRFGTTWGWVINDIIFIFGWTIKFFKCNIS